MKSQYIAQSLTVREDVPVSSTSFRLGYIPLDRNALTFDDTVVFASGSWVATQDIETLLSPVLISTTLTTDSESPGYVEYEAIARIVDKRDTYNVELFSSDELDIYSPVFNSTVFGTEQTFINAWMGGVNTYSQLLPPDSWGWDGVQNPGTLQNDPQIYLGADFDNVDLVTFSIASDVYCFGMDEFYIDEAAPPAVVPEPSTIVLLGGGLAGLAFVSRRRKKE